MSEPVSAATIRNVMQDLEFIGLLDSPHISAGRVPTETGLRLFVDSLLEVGAVAEADREAIDQSLDKPEADVVNLLEAADVVLGVLRRLEGVLGGEKQHQVVLATHAVVDRVEVIHELVLVRPGAEQPRVGVEGDLPAYEFPAGLILNDDSTTLFTDEVV